MVIKKIVYILSIIFFDKIYAQEIISLQKKNLILENQAVSFWHPNDVLGGSSSSHIFIPFFINEKNSLIDNKDNSDSFMKDKKLFVRRNVSGTEVNFYVDNMNSNKNLNINRE